MCARPGQRHEPRGHDPLARASPIRDARRGSDSSTTPPFEMIAPPSQAPTILRWHVPADLRSQFPAADQRNRDTEARLPVATVALCGSGAGGVAPTAMCVARPTEANAAPAFSYRACAQLSESASEDVLNGCPSRERGHALPTAFRPLMENVASSAGTKTVQRA